MSGIALKPAKFLIEALTGKLGTNLCPPSKISFKPASVVAISFLSVILRALGPTKVFPLTVGHTKIPLDTLVGVGNKILFRCIAFLSKRIYSPFLGISLK